MAAYTKQPTPYSQFIFSAVQQANIIVVPANSFALLFSFRYTIDLQPAPVNFFLFFYDLAAAPNVNVNPETDGDKPVFAINWAADTTTLVSAGPEYFTTLGAKFSTGISWGVYDASGSPPFPPVNTSGYMEAIYAV